MKVGELGIPNPYFLNLVVNYILILKNTSLDQSRSSKILIKLINPNSYILLS